MNSKSGVDKSMGMIFGLAIGDALGRPTEFLSLKDIKSKYGTDGIQNLLEPALYTDDTQMTIAITEALIKAGDQDLESIMEAVKEDREWALVFPANAQELVDPNAEILYRSWPVCENYKG